MAAALTQRTATESSRHRRAWPRKDDLACAVAKKLGQPVYIFQCTMDTRPEDLIVTPVLTPDRRVEYHASSVVSAMLTGGIAILDEGNRMPERVMAEQDASLRRVMAEQGGTLRQVMAEQGVTLRTQISDLAAQMCGLHKEVIKPNRAVTGRLVLAAEAEAEGEVADEAAVKCGRSAFPLQPCADVTALVFILR